MISLCFVSSSIILCLLFNFYPLLDMMASNLQAHFQEAHHLIPLAMDSISFRMTATLFISLSLLLSYILLPSTLQLCLWITYNLTSATALLRILVCNNLFDTSRTNLQRHSTRCLTGYLSKQIHSSVFGSHTTLLLLRHF